MLLPNLFVLYQQCVTERDSGKQPTTFILKGEPKYFSSPFFDCCNSITMPFEQSSERPEYNRSHSHAPGYHTPGQIDTDIA